MHLTADAHSNPIGSGLGRVEECMPHALSPRAAHFFLCFIWFRVFAVGLRALHPHHLHLCTYCTSTCWRSHVVKGLNPPSTHEIVGFGVLLDGQHPGWMWRRPKARESQRRLNPDFTNWFDAVIVLQ
eukprot:EG_transcript_27310